jgi:WD40 repeat protein
MHNVPSVRVRGNVSFESSAYRIQTKPKGRTLSYPASRFSHHHRAGQELALRFEVTSRVRKRLLDESTYSSIDTANEYAQKIGSGYANLSASKLWDVATRQALGAFTDYVTFMSKVMFSSDGKTLVSLSHPRSGDLSTDTICLWDIATRQLIGQPLAGPDNYIYDIAYSFDGRMLASFGSGRVLLLWDMNLDSWMAGACRIANRNLKSVEWERYFPNRPYHKTCPDLPILVL